MRFAVQCPCSLQVANLLHFQQRPMYYGLYMSAAGAHAQNTKVEVLSNNLANLNTVGFKRELALLQARESEAIERGATRRGTGAIEDVGGGVRMNATFTDF